MGLSPTGDGPSDTLPRTQPVSSSAPTSAIEVGITRPLRLSFSSLFFFMAMKFLQLRSALRRMPPERL
jgi:hypothetical protein